MFFYMTFSAHMHGISPTNPSFHNPPNILIQTNLIM